MKKYIAIALLMVLGTVYPAYARWSVGTAGGGVAAAAAPACTTSNDSALETIVTSAGATSGQAFEPGRARAQSFTNASNWTLTEYIWKAKDTSATGNVVMQLYTDSAGVPGSAIAGTDVTIAHGSIGGEPEVLTSTLATPKTGLSGGTTYWVVWTATGTGANFSVYVDATTPQSGALYAYDLSFPSSWSTLTDRDIYLVIMGCE